MATSGWNDPAEEERNPHRAEERRHTRDELEARLRERRIVLTGDESDEDVLLIVNAMETFEGRLAQFGEDSFVNTPESSQPDDAQLVIPMRNDDESAAAYAARIVAAAQRIRWEGRGTRLRPRLRQERRIDRGDADVVEDDRAGGCAVEEEADHFQLVWRELR